MSILVWVVALVALFFIARTWLQSRNDDERIADLVPSPNGTPLETLVWPVVGETQLNDDHTSRQQALAQCVEGMPVEVDFHGGGQGAAGTAKVMTRFGEIGTLRNDALEKLKELKRAHKRIEVYIRDLEGGTDESRIRSASLQAYVYDQ